ncbi:hypothetical protein BDW66DRAFT_17668 [Aspergillus desertorum]
MRSASSVAIHVPTVLFCNWREQDRKQPWRRLRSPCEESLVIMKHIGGLGYLLLWIHQWVGIACRCLSIRAAHIMRLREPFD